MEAKDTVMSDEEINLIRDKVEANIKRALTEAKIPILAKDLEAIYKRVELDIAEAQAEISFKAGIREVVEWIKSNIAMGRHDSGCYGVIQPSPSCIACQWQAFKESKGIKE